MTSEAYRTEARIADHRSALLENIALRERVAVLTAENADLRDAIAMSRQCHDVFPGPWETAWRFCEGSEALIARQKETNERLSGEVAVLRTALAALCDECVMAEHCALCDEWVEEHDPQCPVLAARGVIGDQTDG